MKYFVHLDLYRNPAAPAPYGHAFIIGDWDKITQAVKRWADNPEIITLSKLGTRLAIDTGERKIFRISGYDSKLEKMTILVDMK